MASLDMDMGKMLKEKCVVTVRFKMPKGWKIRWWIGGWLICLGARVAGLGYKEIDEDREKLINQVGIHFCSHCHLYHRYGAQNCLLGYVAPSDCPEARKVVIAMLDQVGR